MKLTTLISYALAFIGGCIRAIPDALRSLFTRKP